MKKQFTFLTLMLLCSLVMSAQKVQLVKFSEGFSSLVGVENCGDSRLFIVQQSGQILICDSTGKQNDNPYLDISDRVLFEGERGLLGVAFDPDYLTNGYFYVNYVNADGNTQISRFNVSKNKNKANKNSERFILEIDQPFSNHKGGCTRFGPDGYLYIGMGDGGDQGDPNNNAQDKMSLLGKMLRIDVHKGKTYKIPSDNPFVDSPGYRKEIWALGLRNPWRWSFDAQTGAMYIGDVGQDKWEEVDLQLEGAGGRNYGWRCYEGKHAYNTSGCQPSSSYKEPIYEYKHADSTGDCSITGGFVYRGDKYPALFGKYIFTDYCSGLFRLIYNEGTQRKIKLALDGADYAYTSFGEDVNREIYVCNADNGTVYHVIDRDDDFAKNASGTRSQNRLSLSPNPSKGNVNISYTSAGSSKIVVRISGLLGNEVYNSSRMVSAGINNWSLSLRLPKGNYYVSIINAAGNVSTQSLRIE